MQIDLRAIVQEIVNQAHHHHVVLSVDNVLVIAGFDNVLVLSEMFLEDMAILATALADDLTKSTESVLNWPFHKRIVYQRFP